MSDAPSCRRCVWVGYMLGAYCSLREDDDALSAEVARLRMVDAPAPPTCPLRSEPWVPLGRRS